MMAPAITGNLRALAVDPTDEKNIFVATQEGTLARSVDGGVTWSEIALSPFLFRSPSIVFEPFLYGYQPLDVFAGFKVVAGTRERDYSPMNRDSAEVGVGLAAPPFATVFVKPFWFAETTEPLLDEVAGKDPTPYDDIQHVIVCPGGSNTLFVTTSTKLLGSSDGASFVELFAGRESAPLQQVACSPTDPNEVILTSGDGTFRSLDGGFSFEPIGQVAASSIAFSPPVEGGSPVLFLAAGRELWVGDPAQADAMRAVPVGGDGEIRHVVATSQSVWLATDGGVRVSRDGGKTWAAVDELEGFPWRKVAVGGAAGGREHVLVLGEEIAFLSTDGGATFHPSFRGESRRRLRRVASLPSPAGAPPAFLLLTSGEVWTSSAQDQTEDPKLDEVRRSAARRLKQMPPLHDLLERAVFKSRLSDAQVEALVRRAERRGWFPGVSFELTATNINVLSSETTTISAPTVTTTLAPERAYVGLVRLVWELPDVVAAHPVAPMRANLYEIRKRLSYFIEDAYLERRQVLSQLAGRGLDSEQVLTLQARLDVLDVVLEEFTRDSGQR